METVIDAIFRVNVRKVRKPEISVEDLQAIQRTLCTSTQPSGTPASEWIRPVRELQEFQAIDVSNGPQVKAAVFSPDDCMYSLSLMEAADLLQVGANCNGCFMKEAFRDPWVNYLNGTIDRSRPYDLIWQDLANWDVKVSETLGHLSVDGVWVCQFDWTRIDAMMEVVSNHIGKFCRAMLWSPVFGGFPDKATFVVFDGYDPTGNPGPKAIDMQPVVEFYQDVQLRAYQIHTRIKWMQENDELKARSFMDCCRGSEADAHMQKTMDRWFGRRQQAADFLSQVAVAASRPLHPPLSPVQYAPTSPSYQPPGSPVQYAPTSPSYQPPGSPVQYAPTSPSYQPPGSPVQYAPTSPSYQSQPDPSF